MECVILYAAKCIVKFKYSVQPYSQLPIKWARAALSITRVVTVLE